VFAFANVVHFFTHKFACLCAWRFAFSRILFGSLDGFLVGHKSSIILSEKEFRSPA
jgi:hypothetical protein